MIFSTAMTNTFGYSSYPAVYEVASTLIWIYPLQQAKLNRDGLAHFTVTGNTFSWYSDIANKPYFNISNITYYYTVGL